MKTEYRGDLSSVLLTKHYSLDKIEKNETGEAFAGMEKDRCVQNFRVET